MPISMLGAIKPDAEAPCSKHNLWFLTKGETMPISELMTRNVTTLGMDDSVKLAGAHFDNGGFHHLPIVDSKKRVLGIVSDRDYLKAVSPYIDTPSESRRDLDILRHRIHTIMTRNARTVHKDATIGEAAEILVENQFSSLLVTDSGNVLQGIVTWKDFLKFFAQYPNLDLEEGNLMIGMAAIEKPQPIEVSI